MGILGLASIDSGSVGNLNPAVWAGAGVTRFTGGVGLDRFISRDHSGEDMSDDFSLRFAALGVSLKPGITLGFRFYPQTRADIRINRTEWVGESKYENLTIRRGGVSIGSALLAARLTQKLWLGAQADFIFGTYNDYWRIDFSSIADVEYRLIDHFFAIRPALGVLYRFNPRASVGFFAAPAVELEVSEQIDYTSSDSVFTEDRVFDYPFNLGGGLNFPLKGRLSGAVDFMWNGWTSEDKTVGSPDRYEESYFLGAGLELNPVADKLAPYPKRLFYRAGISYRDLYYQSPAGRTVSEFSGSLGLGVPLKDLYGRIDFALTIGKRGKLSDNDAEEMFINFGFYINTGEKWFVRRKRY